MVKKLRVDILPEAASDLDSIFAYVSQHSPQNAAKLIQTLVPAIDSLEYFPRRYKIHSTRRRPKRIVHSMPVPPFVI
jgi:plasmid stabilization system protein ParE